MTFSKPDVQEFLRKNTVAIHVNPRSDGELAKQFGIQDLPTLVFLDSSGSEIGKYVGFMPAETFLQRARSHVN